MTALTLDEKDNTKVKTVKGDKGISDEITDTTTSRTRNNNGSNKTSSTDSNKTSSTDSNKAAAWYKDAILEMLENHKAKCNGYNEEYIKPPCKKDKKDHGGGSTTPRKTPCRLCIRLEELVARLEKMNKSNSPSSTTSRLVVDRDDTDSTTICGKDDDNSNVGVADLQCTNNLNTVPLWVEMTENYSSKRLLPYSQIQSSMLKDFDMDQVPTPAISAASLPGFQDAKRIRNDYVISYSLYQDNLSHFPYYWLGLKFNIDAINKWYPGWTIHLYVDNSDRMTERPFFQWMIEYAEILGVPLRVFNCREGSHPMLERYRPLMDMETGVCLVRDIDSVLTLTDAKIVKAWLNDKESDVLVYSEYKMWGHSCGGGISMKMDTPSKDKRKSVVLETVVGAQRGRNYDECRLHSWLKKVTDDSRQTIVQNRMTRYSRGGIYCIDFYNPNDTKILWSNSFIHSYNHIVEVSTKEECEEECQRLVKEVGASSFHLHVHAHQKKNRDKLLRPNDRLIWAR